MVSRTSRFSIPGLVGQYVNLCDSASDDDPYERRDLSTSAIASESYELTVLNCMSNNEAQLSTNETQSYLERNKKIVGSATLAFATLAIFILLVNFSLTLWIVINHKKQTQFWAGGIYSLSTQSCSTLWWSVLLVDTVINFMSIILTLASNKLLRIVNSPTTDEVKKSHKIGRKLDIGIYSLVNTVRGSFGGNLVQHTLFWATLFLPVFYNLTSFYEIAGNSYLYMVVTEDFFQTTATYNSSLAIKNAILNAQVWVQEATIDNMHDASVKGGLKNMTSSQCMESYSSRYVSSFSNVLLVTSQQDSVNNSLLSVWQWQLGLEVPYFWICGDGFSPNPSFQTQPMPICELSTAKAGTSNWTVNGFPISYCMVLEDSDKCSISISLLYMVAVLVINSAIAVVFIFKVAELETSPLITIGDAAASFLANSDEATKGICLYTTNDFEKWGAPLAQGKIWTIQNRRWYEAPGKNALRFCIFAWIVFPLCALGYYLSKTIERGINPFDLSYLRKLGSGAGSTLSPMTLKKGEYLSHINTTFSIGIPQFLLAVMLMSLTNVFTSMNCAREWSQYAKHGKALRVSRPSPNQRSAHLLNMPAFHGCLLIIVSFILHLLMSQSWFLIALTIYDADGNRDPRLPRTQCGFTLFPSAVFLLCVVLLVTFSIYNGLKRLDPGIPFVGTCSAAISAACHEPEDERAYLKKVQWGVLVKPVGERPGHCCLTSQPVDAPVVGQKYAGLKNE